MRIFLSLSLSLSLEVYMCVCVSTEYRIQSLLHVLFFHLKLFLFASSTFPSPL